MIEVVINGVKRKVLNEGGVEFEIWKKKALKKFKETHYEYVPIDRIKFDMKISFKGVLSINTYYPPRLRKNKYGDYLVIDGRHRIFSKFFYHDSIPHDVYLGCLVQNKIEEIKFSGFKVWEVLEEKRNFQRSSREKFLDVLGIGTRTSVYFPTMSVEVKKKLRRKSRLLLEKVEDELAYLYEDFEQRILRLIDLVKRHLYQSGVAKKQVETELQELKEYVGKIAIVLGMEQEFESNIEKLLEALNEEIGRKKMEDFKSNIEEVKVILLGQGRQNGLVDSLKRQIRIIEKGKLPENLEEIERELIKELEHVIQVNKNRKRLFVSEIAESLKNAA